MQIFSAGTTDLDRIVIFIVDATNPSHRLLSLNELNLTIEDRRIWRIEMEVSVSR
jgi:hypothetical protein